MPVIAMSRPWLRPHDGKYYLRKRTPARYLEVAGRAEFRIPLNTRDPKEAKSGMAQALATWEAMVADWERALSRVRLDAAGAKALVSAWLGHLRRYGEPEAFGFSGLFDLNPRPAVDLSDADVISRLAAKHAQDVIQAAGIEVAEGSVGLIIKALESLIVLPYSATWWQEIAQARAFGEPRMLRDNELRALLEIPEDPKADEAPRTQHHAPRPGSPPPTQSAEVTFDAIWEAWSKVTATAPRTVHETRGILRQLEVFLGHSNAALVTKADLIRWRTTLKGEGKTNSTWNNRLSLIGQVYKTAVAEDVVPSNPTIGLRLDKGKPKHWLPYSDEDTVAILKAARRETSPALRWAHWVMALSGMRVGEVLQLTGDDIAKDPKSGVWYMAVKDAPDEGKATKNSKPRHVPLHPSLIQEGFLAYAQGIKETHGNAPLFPDKKPDRYGRLGGRAWNLVGAWVRKKVGITDRKKAPNHSWRHRMEDELRAAEVYEADRDAIIGHARKTVGAQYGVRGEALRRLQRELSKVHLPEGL